MARYHIHNSGKHVNKKAADNFEIKTCEGGKLKRSLLAVAENTNVQKEKMTLCFSNYPV